MVTKRPGADPQHYTITITYKPEDGDGLLTHSVEGTETQYSMRSAEQMCWDISKNGIRIEQDDCSIWIPSHRVVSVRLYRKEQDAETK